MPWRVASLGPDDVDVDLALCFANAAVHDGPVHQVRESPASRRAEHKLRRVLGARHCNQRSSDVITHHFDESPPKLGQERKVLIEWLVAIRAQPVIAPDRYPHELRLRARRHPRRTTD
jgi:hypothetical protein